MGMNRKPFGPTFERPFGSVQLRRVTDSEAEQYGPNTVLVTRGDTILGQVDFDSLYDEDGNRFYND
jgi:hypothetical protein